MAIDGRKEMVICFLLLVRILANEDDRGIRESLGRAEKPQD